MNTENNKHTCINEERLKELELKNYKLEILKVVITPKMIIALSLGISFILQIVKG